MLNRQKVAMVTAEFLGTALLAVAVYSMSARTSFPMFSGMAAGLVVGMATLVLGKVSGAIINPAITVGLWSIGKLKTLPALAYIAAQMLGGLAAWALLKYFLGHQLDSVAGKFDWKVVVAEATGALVFGLGFAGAVYQKFEDGKLAFTLGVSLLVGILVASLGSNGIINPAVAVAVRSWSWAYAVAPVLGAVVGMNLYALLFAENSAWSGPALARTKSATVKKRR